VATDGVCLYTYTGVGGGGTSGGTGGGTSGGGGGCISKIGTGMHGTLAGDVSASVTNLKAQLAEYLTNHPTSTNNTNTYTNNTTTTSTKNTETDPFTHAKSAWNQDATSICFGDSATTTTVLVTGSNKPPTPATYVEFPGFCTSIDLRSDLVKVSDDRYEVSGPQEPSEGSDDSSVLDDEDVHGAVFIDTPFDLTIAVSRALLRERMLNGSVGNYCEIEGVGGDDGLRILGMTSTSAFNVHDDDEALGK